MSEWIGLPPDEELSNWFGIVYLITRTNIAQEEIEQGVPYMYVGCKNLKKKKTLPKNSKRKKKVVSFVKSDYEDYYGSSEELKKLIALHGKQNFRREVLHLCESKWILKYMEAMEQIKRNVLFSAEYFNAMCNIRLGKCPKAWLPKYKEIMERFFEK
jgi:hypothetical protein